MRASACALALATLARSLRLGRRRASGHTGGVDAVPARSSVKEPRVGAGHSGRRTPGAPQRAAALWHTRICIWHPDRFIFRGSIYIGVLHRDTDERTLVCVVVVRVSKSMVSEYTRLRPVTQTHTRAAQAPCAGGGACTARGRTHSRLSGHHCRTPWTPRTLQSHVYSLHILVWSVRTKCAENDFWYGI